MRQRFKGVRTVDLDPAVRKILYCGAELEPEVFPFGPCDNDQDDGSDVERRIDNRRAVAALLRCLPPQQARVLTLRHINDMTLEEVGRVLGVTRERIRQIEANAMRRIRVKTRLMRNGLESEERRFAGFEALIKQQKQRDAWYA